MSSLETSDYQYLLQCLNNGSPIYRSQASKRLIALANTDRRQFFTNAKSIAAAIGPLLMDEKENVDVLCSQLLTELIGMVVGNSVFGSLEHQLLRTHMPCLIINLGHKSRTELRKNSHLALLNFVKTTKNPSSIADSYLQHGFKSTNELVQQKSINSFQSILIFDQKMIDWDTPLSHSIMQQLLHKSAGSNPDVAKAAMQCIISLCKQDGARKIVAKLKQVEVGYFEAVLKKVADRGHIEGLILKPGDVRNIWNDANIVHVKTVSDDVQPVQSRQWKPIIKQQQRQMTPFTQPVAYLSAHLGSRPTIESETPLAEKQQNIELNRIAANTLTAMSNEVPRVMAQRRLERIRNSIRDQQQRTADRGLDREMRLFANLNLDGALKERTQAIEELLQRVQANRYKPEFEGSFKALLPVLIKPLRDINPKVVNLSLRVLQIVLDFVGEADLKQHSIFSLIIEKLSDPKISIRQLVTKVIRQLMVKTSKGLWVKQLLENMRRNTNTFLKEESLGLILSMFEQYPAESIDYPLIELLNQLVPYSDDPKTKIKIKTLDCIAQISVRGTDPLKLSYQIKNKMAPVFYQMYVEKLKRLMDDTNRREVDRRQNRGAEEEVGDNVQITIHPPNNHMSIQMVDSLDDAQQADAMGDSLQLIRKRISSLRNPKVMSITQRTIQQPETSRQSVEKEDFQIMLPSLYSKGARNSKVARRTEFTPNKTQQQPRNSEYLAKEDLKPLRDPEKEFKTILSDLKSTDWKILFDVSNKIRRIVEFNPQLILASHASVLQTLVNDLLNLADNLRSSVSKNALICLNQLIIALSRQIDPYIEPTLQRMLKRSADTNSFINEQVQRCLYALTQAATSHKLLERLRVHRQNNVKSASIREACVSTLAAMVSDTNIIHKEAVKLAEELTIFTTDSQAQVRVKARSALNSLCDELGDWYKILRGKVSPTQFKTLCQLMSRNRDTKTIESEVMVHNSARKPIATMETIQSPVPQPKRALSTTAELTSPTPLPIKRSALKIIQYPDQFTNIQSLLEATNSSDWKKRHQSLVNLKSLALQYAAQFCQHRSANRFIDIVCRQIQQPNLKVCLGAINVFVQVLEPLRLLVVNSLNLVCSSVFAGMSSGRPQIRQAAQSSALKLLHKIDLPELLPSICHSCLYSLPKSRQFLLQHLSTRIAQLVVRRKQLLFKHIFPMINKLMDENKAEVHHGMVAVMDSIWDSIGAEMWGHINKFKEAKELLGK